MKSEKRTLQSGDFLLVVLTLGLVIFGIVMVFSSSYYLSIDESGSPYVYLKRELLWALLGIVAMTFTALFDYRHYGKIAIPVLVLSLILLSLLFTSLGYASHGALRWLKIGPITIMPGEIAKFAVIIFVAWYLSVAPYRIRSLSKGILPLLLLVSLFAGLILIQPNLSTAITISVIIILMMFVAGMKWRYLIALAGLSVAGIKVLLTRNPDGFWMKRLTSFLNPFGDSMGDGYQVVQSLLALGSGGLFGVGLGKGVQKSLYLPEPQNDFILAIIGEELGFIGILFLLLAYITLIWRGIHIAVNAQDQFGVLLAAGITIMLAIQVIINVAVVTSSMPATGISLPLVSYGGNALILFMAAMGILLNISRHTTKTR